MALILSPSANTSGLLAGYRVYRDGTQIAATPNTNYKDTEINPGDTHVYWVEEGGIWRCAKEFPCTPAQVTPWAESTSEDDAMLRVRASRIA